MTVVDFETGTPPIDNTFVELRFYKSLLFSIIYYSKKKNDKW